MTFGWGLSLLNKRIPPNVQSHFELFRFSKKEITLVEGLELAKRGASLPDDVLMGPVLAGSETVVRALVRRGANVNCVASEYSGVGHWHRKMVLLTAALGTASMQKHLESIPILLIRSGARVNRLSSPYVVKPPASNRTMLGVAAGDGLTKTVKAMLAAGANVNLRDNYRRTALFDALLRGHLSIAKVLVRSGARVDLKDYEGRTPAEVLKRQEQSWDMFLTEQSIFQGIKVDKSVVKAKAAEWLELRERMIVFLENCTRKPRTT